jgi:hypothetical protein
MPGRGLDLPDRAAVADDAHQELPEAIVQLLEVGEAAHGRMVMMASRRSPCSSSSVAALGGRHRPPGMQYTQSIRNFPYQLSVPLRSTSHGPAVCAGN